jgi:hypothetical protein
MFPLLMTLPMLRNSERSDFKTCQAKWNWRWNYREGDQILGLVPAMVSQNAAWFGSGWHLVWAEHYMPLKGKDGFSRSEKNPHETWDEYCKDQYVFISSGPYWNEVSEKEWHDAQALGHIMIDGYLKQYAVDGVCDPQWEVLMPEQRYAANIPFNAGQIARNLPTKYARKHITRLVGTFDMPIRDHGFSSGPQIVIVDHKTTNKRESVKHLTKDDQGGSYIAVGTGYLRAHGLIGPKESIWGGLWSYARKGKPSDPEKTDSQGRVRNAPKIKDYAEQLDGMTIDGVFWEKETLLTMPITSTVTKKMTLRELAEIAKVRVIGEVSKVQPAPLFWREPIERRPKNRLHQISRIADDAEHMAMIRANLLPVLKNPGEHCNWCPFNDLCDLDENEDPGVQDYIDAVYVTQDPYADHRIGADNSKESVAKKTETGVR